MATITKDTFEFNPKDTFDFIEEKLDKRAYGEERDLNAIVDILNGKVGGIDTPNLIIDKFFQMSIEEVKSALLNDEYLIEEFEEKHIADAPEELGIEVDDGFEQNKEKGNEYFFSKLRIEKELDMNE